MKDEPAPPGPPATAPTAPFPGLDKDCRACSGAQHMIDTFRRLKLKGDQSFNTQTNPQGGGIPAAAAEAKQPQPTTPQRATPDAYEPMPCPPESGELGTASWTFLHSMAAYYPEKPTPSQRSLMRSMMEGLAEFYPCSVCAEHLQQQIQDTPPDVSSNTALSHWLCRIHNEVNEMLGKPLFDCSKVMQRWKDGPPDGSCG